MARFQKGHTKLGGRQKGVANKAGATLKEMILGALDDAGGKEYLKRQAELNPGPFMTLLGKVLPTVVDATHRTIRVEDLSLDELVVIAAGGRARDPVAAQGETKPTKLH